MKSAAALDLHAGQEGFAAITVQMAAYTECRRGDSGKIAEQHIELPHNPAAHESKHASNPYAGRPPGECVHGHNSPDSFRDLGDAREACHTAQVMDNKGQVLKLQLFDYTGYRVRSPIQRDCARPSV